MRKSHTITHRRRQVDPSIRFRYDTVVPESAPSMLLSWRDGKVVTTERADTVADGLAVHLYAGGVAQFDAGATPVRLHVTTE